MNTVKRNWRSYVFALVIMAIALNRLSMNTSMLYNVWSGIAFVFAVALLIYFLFRPNYIEVKQDVLTVYHDLSKGKSIKLSEIDRIELTRKVFQKSKVIHKNQNSAIHFSLTALNKRQLDELLSSMNIRTVEV